ncbi:hypothetical protein MMA231_02505 [Asticcacaulis sp. MM231]
MSASLPRIYLEQEENAQLIRESSKHGPLACSFGGGRVWLAYDDEGKLRSSWALPLLSEWRGYTVSDGAGI